MPSAIPPALPHVLPETIAPSYAVVRSLAVCTSAMRRAYFPTGVWRMPRAKLTPAIDGLLVLATLDAPVPPAQTPPSKSPMNQGAAPAPAPQKPFPKKTVFMVTYLLGSGETAPKSQQHWVPKCVPSASS